MSYEKKESTYIHFSIGVVGIMIVILILVIFYEYENTL